MKILYTNNFNALIVEPFVALLFLILLLRAIKHDAVILGELAKG